MTIDDMIAEVQRWAAWEADGFYESSGTDRWRDNLSVKRREKEHYEHLRTAAPLLAAEVTRLRSEVQSYDCIAADLARVQAEADGLRGLLTRIVKYAREDRATTARATRLARVLDEADAALRGDPAVAAGYAMARVGIGRKVE